METNDSFLTGATEATTTFFFDRDSPSEAMTSFFFDGEDVKLTYRGWITTANMIEAIFDGEDAKITYRGYDNLLFWRGQCETHLLRLKNLPQHD